MNIAYEIIKEKLDGIEKAFGVGSKYLSSDSTGTAAYREEKVKDLMQCFFTKDFSFCKGIIQSLNKQKSNPIDLVITTNNHTPVQLEGKDIILAENVFAVIEVKPNMNTVSEKDGNRNELLRAIDQTKSVKEIDRQMDINVLMRNSLILSSDRSIKIPVVIFSGNVINVETIIEYFKDKLRTDYISANQIPDIIFSFNQGILYHTTDFDHSLFRYRKAYTGVSNHVFMHFKTEDHIQALAFLIHTMYRFVPPHVLNNQFTSEKYLNDLYPKIYPLVYSL